MSTRLKVFVWRAGIRTWAVRCVCCRWSRLYETWATAMTIADAHAAEAHPRPRWVKP